MAGTLPLALVAAGCAARPQTHPAAHAAKTTPSAAPAAAPELTKVAAVPQQGQVTGPALTSATSAAVLRTATFTGIPEAALSAYQRAAQVIDGADPTCHLSWTLLAAIGRLESDHGQASNGVVPAVARDAAAPILGPVLNGKDHTQQIPDTDGGALDGNPRWDRAVGPMQLLPATWSEVAVDADGDGRRDPQDVDDAALGAAVYLCGTKNDLGTRDGKKQAAWRYNHSRSYVLLALAVSRAYRISAEQAVPFGALGVTTARVAGASSAATPDPGLPGDAAPATLAAQPHLPRPHHTPRPSATVAATPSAGPSAPGSPAGSPSGSPTTGSSSPSGSPSGTPSCPTTTPSPTATPTDTPSGCPTPTDSPTGSPTAPSLAPSSPSATPQATPSTDVE